MLKLEKRCESESLLFRETLLSMSEGKKMLLMSLGQFLTLDTVDILGWVLLSPGVCVL